MTPLASTQTDPLCTARRGQSDGWETNAERGEAGEHRGAAGALVSPSVAAPGAPYVRPRTRPVFRRQGGLADSVHPRHAGLLAGQPAASCDHPSRAAQSPGPPPGTGKGDAGRGGRAPTACARGATRPQRQGSTRRLAWPRALARARKRSAGRQQSRPPPLPQTIFGRYGPVGRASACPSRLSTSPHTPDRAGGKRRPLPLSPPPRTMASVEVIRGGVARARGHGAADEGRRATAPLAPTTPRRGGMCRTAGTEAVAGQLRCISVAVGNGSGRASGRNSTSRQSKAANSGGQGGDFYLILKF